MNLDKYKRELHVFCQIAIYLKISYDENFYFKLEINRKIAYFFDRMRWF